MTMWTKGSPYRRVWLLVVIRVLFIVVTMAKYQDGRATFEDLARTALGGNTDRIKYLSWIKERFKKQITDEPASQGPDLAAYLYYVKFQPPVVHPHGYHRTYRQGPVFDN